MKLTSSDVRAKITQAGWFEIEQFWIPVIMKWQTDDEKHDRVTKHQNGVGLSACDAGKITWYYNIINKGMHLDEGQLEEAKKKLIKYSKQYAANTV